MRFFLIALASLMAPGAWASSFMSSAKGSTTGDFLTLAVDARAAAMGEAYCSVVDDAAALYWNPAALTRVQKRSATFMHAAYIDSSFFDYAAYGQKLGKNGAAGASFEYFSAGSITQTDPTGADVGAFTPNDLAASVGAAYRLENVVPAGLEGWSFGAAVKFVRSKIVDSAQTFAADFGVLSPAYLDGRLRAAATLTNLGGRLKFDQVNEDIPATAKAGASFKITPRWLASADLVLPENNGPAVALGTEYLFPVADAWQLAGRAGFNSTTIGDVTGFTGMSLGFGLVTRPLSIDYAFVPFGSVGLAHRFSASYRF